MVRFPHICLISFKSSVVCLSGFDFRLLNKDLKKPVDSLASLLSPRIFLDLFHHKNLPAKLMILDFLC